MPDGIPFRCPVCQVERYAAKALAGRQARCPECGTLVMVSTERGQAGQAGLEPIDQQAETLHNLTRADVAAALAQAASSEAAAGSKQAGTADMELFPGEQTVADAPAPRDENTVAEDFDPYYRWLAIPKIEQPPNHYRLLGLQLFEADADVILNSSERQMAHVKAQAGGKNLVLCQRLLSELSLARICLLDERKRAAYDAELKKRLPASAGAGKRSKPTIKEANAPRPEPRAAPPKAGQGSPPSRLSSPPPPALHADVPLDLPSAALQQGGEPAAPPVQPRWKGAPEPPPRAGENKPQDEHHERVVLRRSVEGEMDMTPMIDVTFLLLIFFICTASFALTMTKPIPAPKEDEPSTNVQSIEDFEDNPDYITVRIDAHNTFRVVTANSDDEAPSVQDLLLKLRAIRREGIDGKIPTTLMVIANSQALHQKVVDALDAGTEVGMEKLQLMVTENDDE